MSFEADYHRASMWIRVANCLVIAGCSFSIHAVDDGGGAADGVSTDTPGGGATGCWQHWLDGTVTIDPASVRELTELSTSNVDDRWPWISTDGRRMYFTRIPGAQDGDVYQASRSTSTQLFASAMPVTNLNSAANEGRAWLTPDELTVALSTDRTGQFVITMNTRAAGTLFGTPDSRHLTLVNNVGTQHYDPFLSADQLRLYLVADTGPGGRLQVLEAMRSAVTDDFSAPMPVGGINNSASNTMEPALYQNEQLIVFASAASGIPAELWYATRTSATASFGAPIQVPAVNSTAADVDPVLSADGCELYFSSNRRNNDYHIFRAQVTK